MNFFFSSRRRHTFFFQAEDGIRDRSPSRGLGDVYKRQAHQMGGGKLATAGGALLGAVGMNMATHKMYAKLMHSQIHQI